MTDIKTRLETVLRSLDLGSPVEVEARDTDLGRVIAIVTSSGFDPMDEYQRQDLVWRTLFAGMDESERNLVEFVFTRSPHDEAA